MNKALKESLIQFVLAMIISWLILFLVPAKTFFTIYFPSSFIWLFLLVGFSVIARGWPMVPPEGSWKPGKSKLNAGLTQTFLTIVLTIIGVLFITKAWPAIPLFPLMLYFGALLFGTTLWYAFIWRGYPVAGKSGKANFFIGAAIIIILDIFVWSTMINFSGTPWENAAFNPNGIFQCDFLLGFALWSIVWIFIFGNSMQGYPFYKIPEPLAQMIQTIAITILAYFCWTVSLKFLDPTFSWAAIGGGIISWSFFHSAFFGFFPNEKYIQPKRGIYNLIIVAIMVAIWIPLGRVLLAPILAKASLAGIPFDLSVMTLIYSLHLIAVLLTVHTFFLFKYPFSIPRPPIGPEEILPSGYKQVITANQENQNI
ncbi:hypothetical protein C1I36_04950 [Dehalobacter sp. 14DCB1]|nr:hypothetical protein C1I36_04950 [Dehalobacter sp. 14DCB1]